MAILGTVAVIAVVGLVLLFKGAAGQVSRGMIRMPCAEEGKTFCDRTLFNRCINGYWQIVDRCSRQERCDAAYGCVSQQLGMPMEPPTAYKAYVSPLEIRGFNPQPEPPGMPFAAPVQAQQ